MDYRSERSIPEMLTNLLGQYTTLFRTETQLVRAEISDKVRQVGTGPALIVAGSVLITPGLVVLLGATVAGLQQAGLAPPWAALAIGGGVPVIGLILLLVGLNLLRAVERRTEWRRRNGGGRERVWRNGEGRRRGVLRRRREGQAFRATRREPYGGSDAQNVS